MLEVHADVALEQATDFGRRLRQERRSESGLCRTADARTSFEADREPVHNGLQLNADATTDISDEALIGKESVGKREPGHRTGEDAIGAHPVTGVTAARIEAAQTVQHTHRTIKSHMEGLSTAGVPASRLAQSGVAAEKPEIPERFARPADTQTKTSTERADRSLGDVGTELHGSGDKDLLLSLGGGGGSSRGRRGGGGLRSLGDFQLGRGAAVQLGIVREDSGDIGAGIDTIDDAIFVTVSVRASLVVDRTSQRGTLVVLVDQAILIRIGVGAAIVLGRASDHGALVSAVGNAIMIGVGLDHRTNLIGRVVKDTSVVLLLRRDVHPDRVSLLIERAIAFASEAQRRASGGKVALALQRSDRIRGIAVRKGVEDCRHMPVRGLTLRRVRQTTRTVANHRSESYGSAHLDRGRKRHRLTFDSNGDRLAIDLDDGSGRLGSRRSGSRRSAVGGGLGNGVRRSALGSRHNGGAQEGENRQAKRSILEHEILRTIRGLGIGNIVPRKVSFSFGN